MATTKTPRTRTSRTKAEVKTEFEEVAASVKGIEALPAKEAELKAARESAVRKAVEDISPETITANLNKAQFHIARTLASVQEQLVQQTQELETIKQAKQLLQDDMEKLHGADKVLTALDVLVQEYEEKDQELSATYASRASDLEQEAAFARKTWEEEKLAHAKALQERNTEVLKNRTREQADFDYNTIQQRKLIQDKFNEELRIAQVTERDRREALEKDWKLRSDALAAKEQEFAALKATVEGVQAKIDAEVKKAEAIVGNSLKREYEHRMQLVQKDAESQNKVQEMQIHSLQDAVNKQAVTIAELQTRLKDSETNVKSIAEKALESASSTRTMAEVRTMLHQEPTNGGGRTKA